jgi:hypothetical protein
MLKGNALVDDKGHKILFQKLSDGKIGFIAGDVPANGKITYHFASPDKKPDTTFTSRFAYSTDSLTASINHLTLLGQEWVLPNLFRGLGEPVYVKGLNPDSLFHSVMIKSEWREHGPVLKTKKLTAELIGTNVVQMEITEFRDIDQLRLSVIFDKKAIREKESIHIAFPFSIKGPVVRIGVDDSLITPEYCQIPGSNKDFYSVQRWLDVSGENSGVTISTPQGALFEIGNIINEERTNNGTKQWKNSNASASTIFLYALNNYWHTNYKADQGGYIRFDFTLTFHHRFNLEDARRTGIENTQRLLVYSR